MVVFCTERVFGVDVVFGAEYGVGTEYGVWYRTYTWHIMDVWHRACGSRIEVPVLSRGDISNLISFVLCSL